MLIKKFITAITILLVLAGIGLFALTRNLVGPTAEVGNTSSQVSGVPLSGQTSTSTNSSFASSTSGQNDTQNAVSTDGQKTAPSVENAKTQSSAAATPGQGDLNNDGIVNINDLSILLSNYHSTNPVADINGDGVVNISDLSKLLANYNIGSGISVPSIALTSPQDGATVSGTVALTATATDGKGVSGVRFKLDGNALGPIITTAPYTYNWNTTSTANGSHTISAVVTNVDGISATSADMSINLQNTSVQPPAPNLIPNPSLETAQDANTPQGWTSSSWGTNAAVFSYLNVGHSGSRSIKTEVTSFTSGAANWIYNDIPVAAGKTYEYENWYQSNVDSEVDAEVQMSDGSTQYFWLGNVLANPNWTKFSTTFTVPAGAKNMAVYQILAKKGYVISDDYNLSEYTAVPFNRALVSITFDDGWANQYTNAYPMLQQYGLPATFYIISGELTDQPDYMSAAQVKNLQLSGHEIGSHSVTHPDLTTVSATQLQNEMANSQATLQNVVGVPVTDFAYPYGAYNSNTIAAGSGYYQSQRTVNSGFNTKDNFNITQLKIYEVDSNITQAQVKGWVDAAIAQKSWLILVYHETATKPADPTDSLYTTQPADLNAELAYIKNAGVSVVTVKQAINEILPQL